MWICSWEQHGQYDSSISIWNTEAEALVAAGSKIMNEIAWWDMNNPETSKKAYAISDKCAAMDWRSAIDTYNDYEAHKPATYSCYISVYESKVKTIAPKVPLLRPLPAGTLTPVGPAPSTAPFKATKEGATCRGPCKQFNDYAYADSPDGTYCCRQCKWMGEIFGSKKT